MKLSIVGSSLLH